MLKVRLKVYAIGLMGLGLLNKESAGATPMLKEKIGGAAAVTTISGVMSGGLIWGAQRIAGNYSHAPAIMRPLAYGAQEYPFSTWAALAVFGVLGWYQYKRAKVPALPLKADAPVVPLPIFPGDLAQGKENATNNSSKNKLFEHLVAMGMNDMSREKASPLLEALLLARCSSRAEKAGMRFNYRPTFSAQGGEAIVNRDQEEWSTGAKYPEKPRPEAQWTVMGVRLPKGLFRFASGGQEGRSAAEVLLYTVKQDKQVYELGWDLIGIGPDTREACYSPAWIRSYRNA